MPHRTLLAARAAIRQRVPFFAGLFTRRRAISVFLKLLDAPGKVLYREARELPPNDLRCRVGVEGRLFGNEIQYLTKGISLWFYMLSRGIATMDSDIVEIGCGCGRRTHLIRDYRFHDERYSGHYLGIDVDAELLDWCRKHFDPARFQFIQSTHTTRAYVNECAKAGPYRIPVRDSSVDLVFSTSVFTHLLEEQLINYLTESYRVLRANGHIVMTCKCLDVPSDSRGASYRFQIGNASVESLDLPEAAVGYPKDFLLDSARGAGFDEVAIHHTPDDVQQTMVGRKT